MVAAVSLGTRSSMTGRWTSEVLDNIKQLLQVFICLFVFFLLAQLRSPNFGALFFPESGAAVKQSSLATTPVSKRSKTDLSRDRQVASALLIAMKLSSSSSSRRVLPPGCVFASVRSPKKKSVFFSGYSVAKHSDGACFPD